MAQYGFLRRPHQADWRALIDNLLRKGTPRRVHHMELFHDDEIRLAVLKRFNLLPGVKEDDGRFAGKSLIALNRFLGFDYVNCILGGLAFPLNYVKAEDTAPLKRSDGRSYMEEHRGPITTPEEFEKYPWPDPNAPEATRDLEWFSENLPEDMCIMSHTGHFAEYLCWLMGYESLCYALYDNRGLVRALADKILDFHVAEVKRLLQFDRVKVIWASDDMGFKTGLMISAADMRELVLSGHKKLAAMAHAAGRPYLLHSCGKLTDILDDLTDDVKIDGKHSFEDTIEDVRQAKGTYGRKIALIGGIDVDFLCRADEKAIRKRVRETLDVCLPGGGYALGSGNSVANYVPLDNYLAMVDEGWRYCS